MVLAWNSWTIGIEHIPWTFSDFTLVQQFNNEHKRLKKSNWDRMISQLFEKQTTIVLKAAHCKIWQTELNTDLAPKLQGKPTYTKVTKPSIWEVLLVTFLEKMPFQLPGLDMTWDPEASWDFLPVDPLKLKLLPNVSKIPMKIYWFWPQF